MDGKVVITGDPSSLISMFQKSADAAQGFSSQASGSIGKVQNSIVSLQAKWVALGTVILSGAGFKEAVDVSVNLTKEANSLGRSLGINATQASILADALGDAFVSSDTMIIANTKMTSTLTTNEEAFRKLGVQTRDNNGGFRDSLGIMMDVNRALSGFKEGTDRNIEGSKIYGKSWNEVAGILKLTSDMMEDSERKVRELNLAIGADSVENVAKYRVAMDDVDDVLTAVKKTIGDAIMPVLTDLGNEFSSTGADKVEIMRKGMAVLIAVFYGVKNGMEIMWYAAKAIIESMIVGYTTLADVTQKALTFDFSGAVKSYRSGMQQIQEINQKGGEAIVAASLKNGAAIENALNRGFNPAPFKEATKGAGAGGAGTKGSSGGDPTEKTRTKEWDATLDQQKQAHIAMNAENGTFFEFSQEREASYWKSILQRHDITAKERYEVERKYTKLILDIQKEQFEARIAGLKLELESYQNNMAERERIALQISAFMKERYGEESKEYAGAQAELVKIKRKTTDQQRAIENEMRDLAVNRSLAGIESENQQSQLMLSMGLITREQLLAQESAYQTRMFEIKRAALAEQMTLLLQNPDMDPVAREQLNRQIQELEIQHRQRMGEISRQAQLENVAPMMQVFQVMESGMDSTMAQMLTRQQSWAQGLTSIYKSVGMAFVQEMVTKPVAAWIAGWVRKLALNMGFLSAETAQQAAAAVTGTGITVAAATTQIGANAAVAGSGAAASQASIPYIGPILAIAAMAAIFAAVSGMGKNVKSAAGGFDIPKGMNPMVQTHEEEMILPSKYANGLREMINGGQTGAREGDVHLHLSAVDGTSAKKFLLGNKSAVADALKSAYRDGKR